jgi:hypothetical protein
MSSAMPGSSRGGAEDLHGFGGDLDADPVTGNERDPQHGGGVYRRCQEAASEAAACDQLPRTSAHALLPAPRLSTGPGSTASRERTFLHVETPPASAPMSRWSSGSSTRSGGPAPQHDLLPGGRRVRCTPGRLRIPLPRQVMHRRLIILTQGHGEHRGWEMDQLNFLSGVVVSAGINNALQFCC